jgi:hypothetical protein
LVGGIGKQLEAVAVWGSSGGLLSCFHRRSRRLGRACLGWG